MTRAQLMAYCLAKPGAWLDQPWGDGDVVKVAEKIFAFLGVDDADPAVGLKCGRDKDEAGVLRARFPADVTISAYIGRYGWNSIRLRGGVDDDELRELVDASYDAVVAGLPRSKQP